MNTCAVSISVQTAAIDIGTEYTALTEADQHAAGGAISCFSGKVRGGEVTAMFLEHYPGMTEKALADIARTAAERWPISVARVVHRTGRLLPGEEIVFVGVLGSHRSEAIAACTYIIDYLKTDAPFWKKEETQKGIRWVASRAEDDAARNRWQSK